MQLVSGSELFAPDEAGFRRPIIDTGDGPVRAYAFATAPNGECVYHCHARSVEVFVAIDGEGVIVVDGKETRMRKGDAMIVEPGEFHLVRGDDDPLQLLCVVAPNLDDAVFAESAPPRS